MPTESSFASVDIPNVDLWGLMFERKDRGFSDDQGKLPSTLSLSSLIRGSDISIM